MNSTKNGFGLEYLGLGSSLAVYRTKVWAKLFFDNAEHILIQIILKIAKFVLLLFKRARQISIKILDLNECAK